MAPIRRYRSRATQLILVAAFTLAGAGAGTAAALATSSSGLIRAVGGAAGGTAGLGAAACIDIAPKRRESAAAALRERGQILDPILRTPPHDHSPFGLLVPTRQDAAPFRARATDLTWLRTWLGNSAAHPAALIIGPAGIGKTRLAVQFAISLPSPWTAGWLRPGSGPIALDAVRACKEPTLILIDDADTSPDTAALLTALASTLPPGTPPARVLMTARTTEGLVHLSRQIPSSARWVTAQENLPIRPLRLFGSTDDQARWLAEAARSYAAAYHTPAPDVSVLQPAATPAPAIEPMLIVQARALLAVLASPHRPYLQSPAFDRIAEALFDHEQDRWQQAATQPSSGVADLDPAIQQRAIASLMLTAAATEPDAITTLQAIPDLADSTTERLGRIARWAFTLYPPGPIQIQPDMLAEWFLATRLTTTPALAARLAELPTQRTHAILTLLAHASDHTPAAVPLYARLIQADPASSATAAADAALTASTGRPLLDAALAGLITANWPLGTLTELNQHLPEGSLPRTRTAISGATVHHTRRHGTPEDLAGALYEHGNNLSDVGRHREALAAYEEALALWRTLAADNPAHQPNLATTIHAYSHSLRDLGRSREALAAEEEALVLWRTLAADNPAHQPNLATTVNCTGNSLGNLGRHRDALAAYEEALSMWRALVADDPAHRPSLATTLTNTGDSLGNLGRHRHALAAEEEALALWRTLAVDSAAHQPEYARALHDHGLSLRNLGRHREALAAYEEALALFRALAADNPAYRPSVATTLTNIGNSLGNLERHRESLAAEEEALSMWRALVADDPARRPSLAKTLTNTGNSLGNLGRHRDALAAYEEALSMWRTLAADSATRRPGLATALTNIGNSLENLERHRDALEYHREALEIYAMLARNEPDLYESIYQHYLSTLRRAYDLQGDPSTSITLHLHSNANPAKTNNDPT